MNMPKIKWNGQEYFLITSVRDGRRGRNGAIATESQYENFQTSTAHLFPNGEIKQYGEVVGTIDDIEFLQ